MRQMRPQLRFTTCLLLALTISLTSGCARYASRINMLYEPVTSVHGMSGDLYISIKPAVQKPSGSVVWALGEVTDDDGKVIDHLTSPRPPAELIQAALVQEFKQAGYSTLAVSTIRADAAQVVEVHRVELTINQVSNLVEIKATCKLLIDIDIRKNGQVIRKLQYASKYTQTDIKDRDLLVQTVFSQTLQAVMRQAVPEIIAILGQG